jgi:tight adherence protein B
VALPVLLAVSLGVLSFFSLCADIFLRDRSRLNRRVDDEFRRKQRQQVQKSSLFKKLTALASQEEEDVKPTMHMRFETMVEQSGLNLRPVNLLMFMATAGLIMFSLGAVIENLWLGAVLGVAAVPLPFLYVLQKRNARRAQLLSQLPDAFDLMARVIRSGQTMAHAMLSVSDEFDKPIAVELSMCYEQMNLGLAPDIALRALAHRCGILEIKIFVMAVIVQQQTGGNLAELLDKLAGVVRERFKVQSKIRTLTAEGRMSALILLLLPFGLFAVLMVVNPEYTRGLFEFPQLVVGMLVAEVLGALWIRKIVNFET